MIYIKYFVWINDKIVNSNYRYNWINLSIEPVLVQFRMTVKILADKILPLFYQTGIAPFLSGQYNRYIIL